MCIKSIYITYPIKNRNANYIYIYMSKFNLHYLFNFILPLKLTIIISSTGVILLIFINNITIK